MFNCFKCGKKTARLIASTDRIGCDSCFELAEKSVGGGVIVKGENRYKKDMTRADIAHIKSRRIGKDGRVAAHPRWETKDF